MKKTTINAILMGIIVLMSISICLLLFAIAKRPRYSTVSATPEPAVITETSQEDIISSDSGRSTSASADTTTTDDEDYTQTGKASTRVNVRDSASTDAKVLGTFNEGDTFEVIEIQNNGWTKILYGDDEAYVSSDYVILVSE